MLLENKVAFITGGGRGIGAAIARRFAQEGADIFIVSRSTDELQMQSEWIRNSTGRKVAWYSADVSNEGQVIKSVERALMDFNKVDILVNSAGISVSGKSEEYPVDKWDSVINTNLKGTFLYCRELGKYFIQKEVPGRIINITSIVAHSAIPQRVAYASSKGGVKQLTENLALEWGHYGIRVNSITPGFIDTAQFRRYVDKGIHDPQKLEARIPLGRLGDVEDMTGPAVFLASDESAYVTGITLIVDGGVLVNGYV